MAYCVSCGAPLAAGAAFCGSCGASTAGPGQVASMSPPPQATQVHVHVTTAAPGQRPVSMGMAIAALLLNVIIWPGLGSLIAGENVGWAQGFLMLLGVALTITLVGAIVGIPLMIGMWIWGIVTGVQLINRANAQQRPLGYA